MGGRRLEEAISKCESTELGSLRLERVGIFVRVEEEDSITDSWWVGETERSTSSQFGNDDSSSSKPLSSISGSAPNGHTSPEFSVELILIIKENIM
ncbi:unnamed protein product [Protopolystoma xenopodis]|uniref:Uncharacterized protein n=1 Tax=Protopolystoma xenopodis TaxID=117903 RepID=A0A3S5A871_9PLAT|nr:unnamed protein product [Protopolystoma xenopodis]